MGKLLAGAAAISVIIPGCYLACSHLFLMALMLQGKLDGWVGFALMPATIFTGALLLLAGLHIGARYGVWRLPTREDDHGQTPHP